MSPRRRCASAPIPASCPRRAWWARRCWRSCSPARTGTSSAGTTSMMCGPRLRPIESGSGGYVARRSSAPARMVPRHGAPMTGERNPALVFIGFMGAGKTTGARAAAAALGVRAVDTDRELEQRLGTSIDDYFASHGERAFREVEGDGGAGGLETVPAPVISLGGGSIGSPRVRELLQRHTVVMLDV